MLSDYTVESHENWMHKNVLVDVQPKNRKGKREKERENKLCRRFWDAFYPPSNGTEKGSCSRGWSQFLHASPSWEQLVVWNVSLVLSDTNSSFSMAPPANTSPNWLHWVLPKGTMTFPTTKEIAVWIKHPVRQHGGHQWIPSKDTS